MKSSALSSGTRSMGTQLEHISMLGEDLETSLTLELLSRTFVIGLGTISVGLLIVKMGKIRFTLTET